ncbi:hypothetical protein BGW38_008717, partial [Lunasporangiospora selenospora]
SNGLPLTNGNTVPDHKEAVFGAFFDLTKIDRLCHQHGLKFAFRMIFVDQHTVRILGEVIPQGAVRAKGPVASQYQKCKAGKTRTGTMDWGEEAELQKQNGAEIMERLDRANERIKDLESGVKKGRKENGRFEAAQTLAARSHRAATRKEKIGTVDGSDVSMIANECMKQGIQSQDLDMDRDDKENSEQKRLYRALQAERKEVRVRRAVLQPQETQLRQWRQERSYWNGLHRTVKARSSGIKYTPRPIVYTTPTVEDFTVEDSTERLDISKLPEDKDVFAGTDPGIRTMSVTCAQTLSEIKEHINRYAVLY